MAASDVSDTSPGRQLLDCSLRTARRDTCRLRRDGDDQEGQVHNIDGRDMQAQRIFVAGHFNVADWILGFRLLPPSRFQVCNTTRWRDIERARSDLYLARPVGHTKHRRSASEAEMPIIRRIFPVCSVTLNCLIFGAEN